MIAALLFAASGAALVPASADAALVLDGAQGAAGLRAALDTAGAHAPSLSPAPIGRILRDTVGVDLLAGDAQWALAARGARVLVLSRGRAGLSAPVADAKAAQRALESWLGLARPSPKRGVLEAGSRAGIVVRRRLITASGRGAAALVGDLLRPKPFSRDKALLARAAGPAWIYLAGQPPLRAAVLALDASATGLIARGLVTAREAILSGPAPAGCEGDPPGCLRAAPGPAGHALLESVFARLGLPPPARGPVVARLDGYDPQRLSGNRSLPHALRLAVTEGGAAQPGPAVDGALDLARLDAALARLTPIDALRGSLAASAYAAHLLYGPLLRNAGPLTLTGAPARGGAEVELRLPLR